MALASGEVDAIIASAAAVMSQMKAGKARALGGKQPEANAARAGLPAIASRVSPASRTRTGGLLRTGRNAPDIVNRSKCA